MESIKTIVDRNRHRFSRAIEGRTTNLEAFFEKIIKPRILQSVRIDFSHQDFSTLNKWAWEEWEPAVVRKYPKDKGSAWQRGISYALSETALERYWGIPEGSIFDRTIGDTKDYDEPDLQKISILNVGIKASEGNKVPLISEHRCYYQIFCYHVINKHLVDVTASTYICGMADRKTIMDNMDPCLTVVNDCTKSGFYGFDKLTPVPEDYRMLVTKV